MEPGSYLAKICGMERQMCGGLSRGQIGRQIGAQFSVFVFLDSRDKSLSILNFFWNDQNECKNKRKTKRATLLRNPLTMHQMHSLASQCLSCVKVFAMQH